MGGWSPLQLRPLPLPGSLRQAAEAIRPSLLAVGVGRAVGPRLRRPRVAPAGRRRPPGVLRGRGRGAAGRVPPRLGPRPPRLPPSAAAADRPRLPGVRAGDARASAAPPTCPATNARSRATPRGWTASSARSTSRSPRSSSATRSVAAWRSSSPTTTRTGCATSCCSTRSVVRRGGPIASARARWAIGRSGRGPWTRVESSCRLARPTTSPGPSPTTSR